MASHWAIGNRQWQSLYRNAYFSPFGADSRALRGYPPAGEIDKPVALRFLATENGWRYETTEIEALTNKTLAKN